MSMIKFGDKCNEDGAGISLERPSSGRFRIEMFGWGFEAYRHLNADEMRAIRDWVNRELGEDDA